MPVTSAVRATALAPRAPFLRLQTPPSESTVWRGPTSAAARLAGNGGEGMGDRIPTLHDPRAAERDACGIGFVADVHGRASRAIVEHALGGLERLRHRGAIAADARTGDGAGLLLPIPAALFAEHGED